MYAAYYLYIKEKRFPDRRRNSMERCIDITFGKVIKGYESTNFGKNIHIDNSLCIVYYKYMEKIYNDTKGRILLWSFQLW